MGDGSDAPPPVRRAPPPSTTRTRRDAFELIGVEHLDEDALKRVLATRERELTDWARLQSSVSDARTEAQSLFRRAERSALRLIFFFSY